MNRRNCRRLESILEAHRADSWSEENRQHLQNCPVCSDAVRVEHGLSRLGADLPSLADLPDPTLIWWRARQSTRTYSVQRATLPIRIAEIFALACGALGLVVGFSLAWPTLGPVVAGWLDVWNVGLFGAVPRGGSPLLLLLGCSILLLFVFGLYSQWAED